MPRPQGFECRDAKSEQANHREAKATLAGCHKILAVLVVGPSWDTSIPWLPSPLLNRVFHMPRHRMA